MNRLKELRKAKHMGQAELASQLHTTQQSISQYETGTRSMDVETVGKICAILGCTSDYLLGWSDIPVLDISTEEWKLVEGYRKLSPDGRELVRHVLALAELGHSGKNRDLPGLEVTEA